MNTTAFNQATTDADILTYSNLIDDISYLQVETSLAEKKKAVRKLAKFLREQGYMQLGDILADKVTELTRTSFCAERN